MPRELMHSRTIHARGGGDLSRFRIRVRMPALFILFLSLSLPSLSVSQPLAKGKSKFLGSSMSSVRSDFATYWNQVTPENAGKWGSVEGSQGNYDWSALDIVYNYAIGESLRYKHHNLVWGSQQPSWITSLDSAAQRAAVDDWINQVAQRYGSASFVDVVNEPFHSPPPYMNALGGAGKTGWDWVITAFQMARKYFFPGVKLLVNDYNILQDNAVTTNYIALIDTLLVRGLIDGVGIQGHYFEFKSAAGLTPVYSYPVGTLKANLDRIAATGLPVYISEFDINEPADSTQLQNYQTYFPLFWEDPGVRGITLWGYVQGLTWKTNAYLVRTDGSERPALQWLRRYLATPQSPVPLSPVGTSGLPRNPRVVWHASALALSYHLQVSASRTFSPAAVDTSVSDTTLVLNPLAANTTYYWQVSAVNDSGASAYSATTTFTTADFIASVRDPAGLPQGFSLSQNYPNPFNPSTVIHFRIAESGPVGLKVYDLLGREIATLVDEKRNAGTYDVTFNASSLPSGTYFYRLRSGGNLSVMKMLVIK